LTLPPTTILAFFDASVTFNNITNWITWGVNSSTGFIGNVFLRVDEKMPNKTLVKSKRLSTLFWTTSDAQNNDSLKYITYQGLDGFGFNIYITFILSDILGYVNYGNALVTPKSFESVVEIPNYPYTDPKNYLSLVIGVVSGSASVQNYGSAYVLQCGTGDGAVYLSLSNKAIINNSSVSVNVSPFADANATDLDNNNVIIQAQTKYQAQLNIKLVTVDFPANASSIIYDPTIGSGIPPSSPDTSNILMIVFIIAGSVLLVIIIIVLVIVFTRRKDTYQHL